jgi:hypothetical protein
VCGWPPPSGRSSWRLRRCALENEAVGRPDVATIADRALSKLVMCRVSAGGEALNDEAVNDV